MKVKQKLKNHIIILQVLVFSVFTAGVLIPTTTEAACKTTVLPQSLCGNESDSSGLTGILHMTLQILSVGIGIVAVGGIAYGAFLYTTSGGSQDGVKKGREVIQNVVIGLVAFIGMYALVSFLLPGVSPF